MKDRPIHFITFGDGNPLQRSAAFRLNGQAKNTGWFTTTKAYGFETLKKQANWFSRNQRFLTSNIRGLGYWIWKPFLIWQTLLNRPLGDLVLYLDAGYEINQLGSERFFQYIDLANKHLIVSWQLDDQPTSYWTKSLVLQYFGILEGSSVLENPMRESSMHLVKNTEQTRSFYREFSLICCDWDYALVDDSLSKDKESDKFIEHRHDQAIYSLLTYDRGIGEYPTNESYPNDLWDKGIHPRYLPFAAMRNKSGASRLGPNAEVKSASLAYFTFIESRLADKGWGDEIIQ